MAEALQHISISRVHIQLLLLLLTLSRRSFSKTERNATRHDSSGGVMKQDSFGSGRVRSGERRSLPDSTQASLFFRSALTIAPFTAHFVLPAEVLEQALLSLDKLSENSLAKKKLRCRIQETTNIFFRVSSGATYYERDKMNAITRGIHNNLI